MKVPPKRKGNCAQLPLGVPVGLASMKVPPKRKGNDFLDMRIFFLLVSLNESPSEKEGKSQNQ